MHKPLLSVYFLVEAAIDDANGNRYYPVETVHKVCYRDEITSPAYLNHVAYGLYVQFKHTANRVIRLVVKQAEGPGGERFPLNHTAMPGDIDPDWRAA